MEHSKENENQTFTIKDNRKEWIAPEMTVLNTGATAGGGAANSAVENSYYHVS